MCSLRITHPKQRRDRELSRSILFGRRRWGAQRRRPFFFVLLFHFVSRFSLIFPHFWNTIIISLTSVIKNQYILSNLVFKNVLYSFFTLYISYLFFKKWAWKTRKEKRGKAKEKDRDQQRRIGCCSYFWMEAQKKRFYCYQQPRKFYTHKKGEWCRTIFPFLSFSLICNWLIDNNNKRCTALPPQKKVFVFFFFVCAPDTQGKTIQHWLSWRLSACVEFQPMSHESPSRHTLTTNGPTGRTGRPTLYCMHGVFAAQHDEPCDNKIPEMWLGPGPTIAVFSVCVCVHPTTFRFGREHLKNNEKKNMNFVKDVCVWKLVD